MTTESFIEVARQFGSAEANRRNKTRNKRVRDWMWRACSRCWRTSSHEFIYELGYGDEQKNYCLGHLPDEWARGYMLQWHGNRSEYAWYRVERMRRYRDEHPRS